MLDFTPGLVHDSWSKDTNARIKDHLGVNTHKGLLEKRAAGSTAISPHGSTSAVQCLLLKV